jgi:hypothetical protein
MRWILLLFSLCFAATSGAADLIHAANLDGDQEVPPNASAGSGFAVSRVSEQGTKLRIAYSWRDLGSGLTAAHIHGPAPIGENAGVVLDLTPPTGGTAGEVVEREFDITAEQLEQLVEGLWYVNLHTTDIPAGEIRGQLLPAASTAARLQGAQEVPAVETAGSGDGWVVVNDAGDLIWVALEWRDLEGETTAAHIHGPADRGVNAGVLFDIVPAVGTNEGREAQFYPVDAQDLAELRAGLWYFNVHSSLHGPGEVRGQLDIVFHDGFEP